jgi:hypothetical protein
MTEQQTTGEGSVLLLQVPRTNDKKALAAEQMFASLQGLLAQPPVSRWGSATRERLSFEIAVIDQRIAFYIWVPTYLREFVQEQVYAQYPTVQISEVPDYARSDRQFSTSIMSEMHLKATDALPIKTFQSFEVDPLAAITATLAKFSEDEEAWLQLVIRPASDKWHQKNENYISGLRSGAGGIGAASLLKALWTPPTGDGKAAPRLTEYDQLRVRGAETKGEKLAYETSLRIVYRGNGSEADAKLRLQSIAASYKQFNTTYLNGFVQGKVNATEFNDDYANRALFRKSYVMNIEEVATLYHLPHTNVETPYILWAKAQTAEPPATLPLVTTEFRGDISPIAATNFRGQNTAFGLPRSDRGRHLYILGQTGVGKSGLLELLTISDIYSPYGFAVIDPHGDYAQNILKRIPAHRVKDVVYFNAADMDFPIAFNPLEVYDPRLKTHTCSELIGVLKRLFDSWGPRLEYILRYSILALLDYPNATMLDITRILTDKKFRAHALTYVTDPVVRNFWQVEFASWNDKFAAEAVAPVLNKVGAFTANPLVRNIIGQPKSGFNIRDLMDQRKILIVNLSRGLVGEDNASLLGALIVTKMQMAAMSRADVDAAERAPFYLYVDEFQNFATDSFATILSEARKYGLYLTVANQYTAQMMQEVKDAVFGNVGSIIAFRMSADDARTMLRYFEPKFTEFDLIHMHNRHCIISMTIDGEKSTAFSAITLDLPDPDQDHTPEIVSHTHLTYGRGREEVEATMNARYHEIAPAMMAPSQPRPQRPKPIVQPLPAEPVIKPVPAVAPTIAEPPVTRTLTPEALTSAIGSVVTFFSRQADTVVYPLAQPQRKPAPTPKAQENTETSADAAEEPKKKRRRRRRRKPDSTPPTSA